MPLPGRIPIYGKFGLNKTPKGTDLYDIFPKVVTKKSVKELGNTKAYFISSTVASLG